MDNLLEKYGASLDVSRRLMLMNSNLLRILAKVQERDERNPESPILDETDRNMDTFNHEALIEIANNLPENK